MEGEANRREDGDLPEGQSGNIDVYKDEIRKKYPDSGDDGQGEAQSDSGEASARFDGSPRIKLDDASRAERSPEQSSDAKSDPNAEGRSDAADDEGRTAEHSEPNAKPESQSDLEQLREYLRKKYPDSEVSEGDGHDELDRKSQSEEEGAKIAHTQDALGEQAAGSSGLDGAPQAAEGHIGNSSVEAAVNHGDLRDPQPWEAIRLEHGLSAEGGEQQHLEADREQRDALEPRLRPSQPSADAMAETTAMMGFSTDQSHTEIASVGRELHERQEDFRKSTEKLVNTIPDSKSSIKAGGIEPRFGEPSETGSSRTNNQKTQSADMKEQLDLPGAKAQKERTAILKAPSKESPSPEVDSTKRDGLQISRQDAVNKAESNPVNALKSKGDSQDSRALGPPDRRYTIHNEAKEPLFIATESRMGRAHYLHIPREHLPKTENGDILEARVARSSAPEKEYRLYTSSNFKDSHIYISPFNPARHESFDVMSLERYGVSSFVLDFNEHKPNGFANVTLSHSDGRIMLRVDKSQVEIKEPKLTSDGSRAILHGTFAENANHGGIRIAKQFETYRLDLADLHARITQMKGMGDRIQAGYRLSDKEPYLHVHQINAKLVGPPGECALRGLAENRLLELDHSHMSREEIRAWIDTEGHIYSCPPGKGGPQIKVSQKYREPLETFVMGVKEFGVKCIITTDKRTGQYIAVIADTEGVAKVISEVGPFRAPQRREQVRRLIEHLKMERKQRRRVVERALKLLESDS